MPDNIEFNAASDGGDPSAKPMTYEQRIAHLSAGYENSQSVARFLDTKAAAIIGGVPVLLGILGALYTWLGESTNGGTLPGRSSTWLPTAFAWTSFVFSVLLTIFAWSTLQKAFSAILPGGTGNALPSVLFPFDNTRVSSSTTSPAESFARRLALFAESPSQPDAIEDYQRQLRRMSEIVALKLSHVNAAVHRLKLLLTISAVALLLMIGMAFMTSLRTTSPDSVAVPQGCSLQADTTTPAATP